MTEVVGMVIFLNGTSSSGKSSIAAELQRMLEQPFAIWGWDSYRRLWGERRTQRTQDGAAWRAAGIGFLRCVAALASAGNNVIVDCVLRTDEQRATVATLLRELPVYLVGVRCPLEVVEQRERDRGDRRIGIARSQFHEVHVHGVYDVEVDTSTMSAAECARVIKQYIASQQRPAAFQALCTAQSHGPPAATAGDERRDATPE